MIDKTQLEIAIQKIDELRTLIEKQINSSDTIPNIEKALVMEKLQFVYDIYFKISAKPTSTSAEKIEQINDTEDLRPQPESSIDDFHEAADESVITPLEEDTLVQKPENDIDLFANDKEIIKSEELEVAGLVEEKTSAEFIDEEIEENEFLKDQNASSDEKIDLFSTSFDANAKTVAQEISEKVKDENIAEKLQKNKISDIKEAIGINEKFYFINELFDGVMKEYNETIEKLNSFTTETESLSYLTQIKGERSWSDDSEAFVQLKEILERKFSAKP